MRDDAIPLRDLVASDAAFGEGRNIGQPRATLRRADRKHAHLSRAHLRLRQPHHGESKLHLSGEETDNALRTVFLRYVHRVRPECSRSGLFALRSLPACGNEQTGRPLVTTMNKWP